MLPMVFMTDRRAELLQIAQTTCSAFESTMSLTERVWKAAAIRERLTGVETIVLCEFASSMFPCERALK